MRSASGRSHGRPGESDMGGRLPVAFSVADHGPRLDLRVASADGGAMARHVPVMPPDHVRRRRTSAGLVALTLIASAFALVPASPASAADPTAVMRPNQLSAPDLAGWYRSTGKVSKATVSIDSLASDF